MRTVLSEFSPDGGIRCDVMDDGKTVYLYLYPARYADFRFRFVWVRNRVEAPDRLKVVRGLPPVMPAKCSNHPKGAGPIKKSKAKLVWLPEGNGVALYEGEDMLAALTPWSGMDGFPGFARDAIGEGRLAWALHPENRIHAQFSEAREFWKRWRNPDAVWKTVQDSQIDSYTRQLGQYSHYYAIDQNRWPPKALIRIPYGDHVVLVTVGVCVRPQPNVELYYDADPQPLHRIELGAVLRADIGEDVIEAFLGYMSGQSSYPWSGFTWLSHGHSIQCSALKGSPYSAVLLANSRRFGPYVELEDWDDLPVWLLWMVPVTAEELQIAKEQRSDTVLSKIQYPR
jgi:hypothetical protein